MAEAAVRTAAVAMRSRRFMGSLLELAKRRLLHLPVTIAA
jgi:hypothetical protein